MSYIKCENLVCGYEKKIVTCPLNFEVNKGDYISVIGENGIGKSTLIKTLLKLIPVISGELIFSDGLMAHEIGYLPQQSMAQRDFPATVMEIVLSGTLNKRKYKFFYNKHDKKIAMENIEKMGISNLLHESYKNLSGGQQQRVLLARALCATSKLILLDEPATGLDPKATLEFYKLIAELNSKFDITIIMVSHDINSTVKHAKSILHIGSEQLFFGKNEDYIKTDYFKAYGTIIK